MTYHYEIGAIRWRRNPVGDPRSYRCAKGWSAEAMVIDSHPITGKPLKDSQWWIREEFTGDEE